MIRQFLCVPLLALAISPLAAAQAAAPPKTAASAASTWGVPRAECFPVERLSPALRARAEELLLKALDGEALYTLVGGVKPMSSGWLAATSDGTPASNSKLEELRRIVATMRCGDEIESHLHHFARVYSGKIALEGVMFGQGAMRKMIRGRQQFWSRWAITPHASPLEALMAAEYAPPSTRFRGYGLLFGYPQHAVDFFVQASEQQEADPAKKLVPRDFLSIPTFAGDTNRFVYAVPKGQAPNAADIELRQRCAPILAEYRRRRALYIGAGKRGVVELVRDWFSNGRGRCSPQFARAASTWEAPR